MHKLLGNPYSVPTAYGDVSHGYSFSYKEEYEDFSKEDPSVVEDIQKIVDACKTCRFDIDPDVAYYAWKELSDQESAHWLELPKDSLDIFDGIRQFLIVEHLR